MSRGRSQGPRVRTLGALGALGVALGGGACDDESYRSIGGEIAVVSKRADAFVAPAQRRLAAFGRRALPQIETALHTASPRGRLQLVATLRAIDDPEAIPILRHFAVYDAAAEVRQACEALLKDWAARGDSGERARQALAAVTDRRQRGEGPLPPRNEGAK